MKIYLVRIDFTEYLISANSEDEAKNQLSSFLKVSSESASISNIFDLIYSDSFEIANNIQIFKYSKTQEKHLKIIESYKQGLSLNEVAKKHHCSYMWVYLILKKNNIPARPQKQLQFVIDVVSFKKDVELGLTEKELCEKYERTLLTIVRIKTQLGLPVEPRSKKSKIDFVEFGKDCDSKVSLKNLAKKHNISIGYVTLLKKKLKESKTSEIV